MDYEQRSVLGDPGPPMTADARMFLVLLWPVTTISSTSWLVDTQQPRLWPLQDTESRLMQ